jgi:pimeloyl-ACP methyl ester carboxylesterase
MMRLVPYNKGSMNVLVDGQLIHYSDEGNGRVIVLLHGWGANFTTFNELNASLIKKYRVIRLDFPGFGSSPKPKDVWSVSDYGQLVSRFLSKIEVTSVYAMIGHSFGGRVTIKGIADNNLQPQKVVLVDAAGVKPPKAMRQSIYKSIAKLGKAATALPVFKAIRPMLRKKLYNAAGSSDYLNANEMQLIFLNTINEDLLPFVQLMTQPTLLIWGKNDKETPVSDAEKMMHELPKGRLVVIDNAGHFVYIDAFKQCIKELDAFL